MSLFEEKEKADNVLFIKGDLAYTIHEEDPKYIGFAGERFVMMELYF